MNTWANRKLTKFFKLSVVVLCVLVNTNAMPETLENKGYQLFNEKKYCESMNHWQSIY